MDFVNEFNNCMQTVLSASDSFNIYYVKEFVIEFLVSLVKNENELNIQHDLIDYLLKNIRANSVLVRYRICDMLEKFLELLNKSLNGELEENLITKIQMCLIERNRDINIEVQKASIRASASLQFPHEKYCPIISSYIYLLKHESMVDVKILIMNNIVLNKNTLNFFKTQLIFDTNPIVSNKAMSIIEKKLPIKYIDAKLRRILIIRLIQNKNEELLEKFILKFLEIDQWQKIDASTIKHMCTKFLIDLDLEKIWYSSLDYKDLNYTDEILNRIMDIVYRNIFKDLEHLASELKSALEDKQIFQKLEKTFFCRTLVDYMIRKEFKDLKSKLNVDDFLAEFVSIFKNRFSKTLISFNIIHVLFKLFNIKVILEDNANDLFEILYNLDLIDDNVCLFELILSRLRKNVAKELVWDLFEKLNSKDVKQLEKFILVFSIFLAKLTQDDYDSIGEVNIMNLDVDIDLSETSELNPNWIDFFVDMFLVKNIPSVEPKIRALCVRCIGLASIISYDIALQYSPLLIQTIQVDYPIVVYESLKALFNIFLCYPNLNEKFDSKSQWEKALCILEKQLDCLNNNMIRYIALEGFAKLLLNKRWLPNKHECLSKLIVNYITDENTTGCNNDDQTLYNRMKSCLGYFLEKFIQLNRKKLSELVIKTFIPTLKNAVVKNKSCLSQKKLSDLFYYLTFNSVGIRQLMISSILEEIFRNFDDYKIVNRWIEVLIEINIHQLDFDENDCKELASLTKIVNQLLKIITNFRQRQWRLPLEADIKYMIRTLKALIKRNEDTIKRKNPNSNPYLDFYTIDEEEN